MDRSRIVQEFVDGLPPEMLARLKELLRQHAEEQVRTATFMGSSFNPPAYSGVLRHVDSRGTIFTLDGHCKCGSDDTLEVSDGTIYCAYCGEVRA